MFPLQILLIVSLTMICIPSHVRASDPSSSSSSSSAGPSVSVEDEGIEVDSSKYRGAWSENPIFKQGYKQGIAKAGEAIGALESIQAYEEVKAGPWLKRTACNGASRVGNNVLEGADKATVTFVADLTLRGLQASYDYVTFDKEVEQREQRERQEQKLKQVLTSIQQRCNQTSVAIKNEAEAIAALEKSGANKGTIKLMVDQLAKDTLKNMKTRASTDAISLSKAEQEIGVPLAMLAKFLESQNADQLAELERESEEEESVEQLSDLETDDKAQSSSTKAA